MLSFRHQGAKAVGCGLSPVWPGAAAEIPAGVEGGLCWDGLFLPRYPHAIHVPYGAVRVSESKLR